MAYRRFTLFGLFALCWPKIWVCAQRCYWPNGDVASDHSPCNASAAVNGGSVCCATGSSVCTSTGYCMGQNVYPFRGSCTDPKWSSPVCSPRECMNVNTGSFCHIVSCGPEGQFNTKFCCQSGKVSCCNSTFNNVLGYPTTFPTNLSSSAMTVPSATSSETAYALGTPTNLSSSAMTVPSATSSETAYAPGASPTSQTNNASASHPKDSSHPSTAIGAGVGVPLGFLLLLSLCLLFYREWRLRLSAETLMQKRVDDQTAGWVAQNKAQEQSAPQELDNVQRPTPELHARQITELGML